MVYKLPTTAFVTYGRASLSLRDEGLSSRAIGALLSLGFRSATDVRSAPWEGPDGLLEGLLNTRFCGVKTVDEVRAWRSSKRLAKRA